MEIAILIMVYWIWLVDVGKILKTSEEGTNIPSTVAMILLSWETNQTWGIVMTVVGCLILLQGIVLVNKKLK